MTDKTPSGASVKEIKQFRDYIRAVADDLRCKFFLQEYELEFDFNEEEAPDPHGDGKTGAAKIETDCVYLGILLIIYHELYNLWQHNQLQKIYQILVHEFCHALLAPLMREVQIEAHPNSKSFLVDINERQTQRIANVICHSDFDTVPWKKKIVKR